MTDFLDRFSSKLAGDEFEEIPVEIEEFIHSPKYLNMDRDNKITLSDIQYGLIKNMSQIYKYETLVALYGEEEARKRDKENYFEIIMQLGKGSGKDFTSTIAVAYVVYRLLCLKSPTNYYNNRTIDIINIAINADQAQRVFFDNFMELIKHAPWFENKYDDKSGYVEFPKKVFVYSGHSEREAYEGYNTFMIILDEIAGFAMTSNSGNAKAKTAPEIYKWARRSVNSRNSQYGKIVLLSFPRYKGDFIQSHYESVIADKETILHVEQVMIDPDRGWVPENLFEVKWEEDIILRYNKSRTFALRRPSWIVNPTKDLQIDYAEELYNDPADAYGAYACMPSNSEDTYFKNMEKAYEAFSRFNGVDDEGVFHPNFKPKEGTKYYMHVDLAQKHDRCAVSMAHVDSWVEYRVSPEQVDVLPVVIVDAIRYWQPTSDKHVDFKDVVNYIKAVRRRGFDIALVTFDRWNSNDTMKDLNRNGIDTDILSVAKKHYDDFKVTMYDDRLVGPHSETLLDEMSELLIVKDKIDHPRTGYKDLTDSVAGAIFDAVTHTPRDDWNMIDVMTLSDLRKKVRGEREEQRKLFISDQESDGVIRAPKSNNPPPDDVAAMLEQMDMHFRVV